jgi:hypothetical protein
MLTAVRTSNLTGKPTGKDILYHSARKQFYTAYKFTNEGSTLTVTI